MMRFLKKTIGVMLTVCMLVSCCMVLVSADTSNSRSTGQLSSGIYCLKNVGSEKYLDSSYNGIGNGVEQVSMKSIDAGQLDQAFKVTYLGMYGGEPCYSIRPMEDSYCVLGATYPEYTDVAEFHSVSGSDNYSVLGEENVWYIISDGDYYKLKNKYFGEAVYDIYGDDSYINNAYLCAADDEDFSKLMISFIDESCPDYGKWELIPYTQTLERLDIVNPIEKILKGATYDFNAIAYSTRIGVNGPLEFSVENVDGIAEINSYSGVLQAVSPGLVRVVITYGDMTRKYDVYIETEYYIVGIAEGSNNTAEDDKYIYMNAKYGGRANQLSSSSDEDISVEQVKWKIEKYDEEYFLIKNEYRDAIDHNYLTLLSNAEWGNTYFTDISGTPSDSQLWRFIQNSDGSYTIKSKLSENINLVLAGIPDSSANPNLLLSQNNSQTNYIYRWYIYDVGGDVALLSIKDGGHDHLNGVSQTLPHLYNLGYNGFDFTDIEISSMQEAQANQELINGQIINKMENSKVFISRSHGGVNANETCLVLYSEGEGDNKVIVSALSATDIYDFSTQTAKVDLSGCDFAMFVGCDTAKEGCYTLPDAAARAGAKCAIGFKESITCGPSNEWVREFLKLYENQYATGRPVDFEDIAEKAINTVLNFNKYKNKIINLNSVYIVCSNNVEN